MSSTSLIESPPDDQVPAEFADLLGCQEPVVCTCPPYTRTLGPEAVELAASAGLIADPWQALTLNHMLAIRPNGNWTCSEFGIVVPRQNGKGSIYEMRALAGLYLLGEPLIMWSAHEYKTAMEGFRRTLELIQNSTELSARVYKVSNTNGDEGIELHGPKAKLITGRQRLRFIARSKGSGRGFPCPVHLLDEVFAYTPEQQAALLYTVSAQENSQIVYASSPPLDAATGLVLFGLKERGEAGDDPEFGWMDWGARPGIDYTPGPGAFDDPRLWARTNPGYGRRISYKTVAKERRATRVTDPEGFGRERLGIWPETAGETIITPSQWKALEDAGAPRPTELALAVDITPDRKFAAIAMAGLRPDGHVQVAIIDHRPDTDWVAARLSTLKERYRPVGIGIDLAGPAGSLVLDLAALGIKIPPTDPEELKRGMLAVPTAREVAQAWGQFVDACRHGRLRHSDDEALNLALAGAKARPLGDGSAWARRGIVDICPLVAATSALWAYEMRKHLAVEKVNLWDHVH